MAAEVIATLKAADVTEEEIKILEAHLDKMADGPLHRPGDIVEFLTEVCEGLRQGKDYTLLAVSP